MEENKKEVNRLLNKLSMIRKNHKGSRKGFTLVELLVVIAIVAILGTVSVVAYLGFVNSANISNDNDLVVQLNTYLKAKEQLNGAPATYYDMENVLKNEGITISELDTFTDGARYAWNSEDNQLVVLDKNNDIIKPNESAGTIDPKDQHKYFVSMKDDNFTSTANFSHYLRADYSGSAKLDVTAGLDVGNSGTKVTSINYTNPSGNEKKVVIRSNSEKTTLSVIDTNVQSHIKQYGTCGIINVTVAMNSMEINGTVGYLDVIEQGHIVVNGSVELVSTAITDTSKVLVEGNVEHAHVDAGTNSKTVADTLNTNIKSVAWDYDSNSDQNTNETLWSEVYHHTGYSISDPKSTNKGWSVNQGKDEVAIEAVTVAFESDPEKQLENYIARIADKGYMSLSTAISEAKSGDTVVLLKNTTETSDLTINKNIQLIGTNIGTDEKPVYPSITGAGYQAGDGSRTGKSGIVVNLGNILDEQYVVVKNLKLLNMGNYGAIEVSSSNSQLIHVQIKNVACDTFYRMGISVHGGNVDISDCTIDSHLIKASVGNGINFDGYELSSPKYIIKGTVTNTTVTNSAQESSKWASGGICLWGNVDLTIDKCIISNARTAISGVAETNNKLKITNTSISNSVTGLDVNKYLYENEYTTDIELGEGNNFNCSNKAIYVGIGEGYEDVVKLNITGGSYTAPYSLILSDYASYHISEDNYDLNDYLIEGSSVSSKAKFNGEICIVYDGYELTTYESSSYKVNILSNAGINPTKIENSN